MTKTRLALLAAALLVIVPGAARADTYVDFTLSNVTFGPAGSPADASASGSFVLDTTTDKITSVNITTTAAVSFPTGLTGSFPGTSYTDATQASFAQNVNFGIPGMPISDVFTFGAGSDSLQLTVVNPVSLTGATILELFCGTDTACGVSFETELNNHARQINGGSLVASPVATPLPAARSWLPLPISLPKPRRSNGGGTLIRGGC